MKEDIQALEQAIKVEERKEETRIVKHRVEYTLSSKAVSSHDNLGGDLARYNHSCPIDLQGKGREITDADNPTTGE